MASDPAKKVKTEQLAVLGLSVLFAAVFLNSLRTMGVLGGRKHAPAVAAARPAAVTPPAAMAGPRTGAGAPKGAAVAEGIVVPRPSGEPTYTAQGLRDPMQSVLPKPAMQLAHAVPGGSMAAAPEPTPPELHVEGFWWEGVRAKAMIGGQLYGIGDEVQGVRITGISRHQVTGDFHGRPVQFDMMVRESSSKRVTQPSRWR